MYLRNKYTTLTIIADVLGCKSVITGTITAQDFLQALELYTDELKDFEKRHYAIVSARLEDTWVMTD